MKNTTVLDVRGDITPIKIGDRLYSLRKGKGLSQARLAERVGVSTKTVSNWETGAKLFSISHLITLSNVLEVKTDDILCLTAEDVVLHILSLFCYFFILSNSRSLLGFSPPGKDHRKSLAIH